MKRRLRIAFASLLTAMTGMIGSACNCQCADQPTDAQDSMPPAASEMEIVCQCPLITLLLNEHNGTVIAQEMPECVVCTVESESYKPCTKAVAACPAIGEKKLKDAPLCDPCKKLIMKHAEAKCKAAAADKKVTDAQMMEMKLRDLVCPESAKANEKCTECPKKALKAAKEMRAMRIKECKKDCVKNPKVCKCPADCSCKACNTPDCKCKCACKNMASAAPLMLIEEEEMEIDVEDDGNMNPAPATPAPAAPAAPAMEQPMPMPAPDPAAVPVTESLPSLNGGDSMAYPVPASAPLAQLPSPTITPLRLGMFTSPYFFE